MTAPNGVRISARVKARRAYANPDEIAIKNAAYVGKEFNDANRYQSTIFYRKLKLSYGVILSVVFSIWNEWDAHPVLPESLLIFVLPKSK